MQDPNDVVEVFRQHGLRVTPQRKAIFDAVHQAGGHVTVEAIFEHVRVRMPTISLKTVYETLHSLAIVGQVQKLDVGPGSMRFDKTVRPHHHLICLSCHRMEDVDIEVKPLAASERRGFSISFADVIAWGVCPDCNGDPRVVSS